jgi:hypothetical protein
MPNRVSPGQAIRADHLNRVIEPINRAQARPELPLSLRAASSFQGGQEAVLCAAANSGTTPIGLFQPCIIRASLQDAGDRNTLLSVSASVVGDNTAFIAFAAQPLAPGQVGPVCVAGICWAASDGSTGPFATLAPGGVALACAAAGPIQVLANDTKNKLLLVRFPVGGAGAESAGDVKPHSHSGYWDGGYLNQLGGTL